MVENFAPVDTFDPRPDGAEPAPLKELVAVAESLAELVAGLRDALLGCTTPLNLRAVHKELEECHLSLLGVFTDLDWTQAIIEENIPIAARFGHPGSRGMQGPGPRDVERGEVLSPKQIITLQKIHEDQPDYPQTTYSSLVAGTEAVPTLIVDARPSRKTS